MCQCQQIDSIFISARLTHGNEKRKHTIKALAITQPKIILYYIIKLHIFQ